MGQLENKKNIESFTGLEKSRMFGGLEGMQESWWAQRNAGKLESLEEHRKFWGLKKCRIVELIVFITNSFSTTAKLILLDIVQMCMFGKLSGLFTGVCA